MLVQQIVGRRFKAARLAGQSQAASRRSFGLLQLHIPFTTNRSFPINLRATAEQLAGSAQRYPSDVPPRPQAPGGSAGNDGGGGAVNAYRGGGGAALPPPLQLLNAALGAPLAVIGGSVRLLVRALGFGATVAGAVARAVLPRRLSAALGRAGRAIASAGAEVAPAAAAAEFVQQFTGVWWQGLPRAW